MAAACRRATSSMLRISPEPMLMASPTASGRSSASRKARATSDTCTKSRFWAPSSNTIGRASLAIREAKMASTPV